MSPALSATLIVSLLWVGASEKASPRPVARGLTREVAELRASQVSEVRYHLKVSLDAEADRYQGRVEIGLELRSTEAPLTIDFEGGSIQTVSVNGSTVDAPDYNGFFLSLPTARLRKGTNTIAVEFSHPYSTSGEGLHRFRDPEDGKTYLFTDFEPYLANQLFPCFDQPDLKARYRLEVEAPETWVVVSAAREEKVEEVSGERLRWSFPETKPFSTYLFSLHAGEYVHWTDPDGPVPLRIFARRSLAKYLVPGEWFGVARRGLSFYGRYFGISYPFEKYDHVIAPELNYEAMENVGAVTISEELVFRSPPTLDQRESRARLILHEMAHMWFGNLVTMRWWDDLWLNESFASYMAAVAVERATDYRKSWLSFFTGMKQWAYWEDQLITTHPIQNDVPSTAEAFASFDGITYGKGAATLKQIAWVIGEDRFREGVRSYFKRHAFSNATLEDFIGSLEASSQRDLSAWSSEWLRAPGLNTLEVSLDCADGKIKGLELLQSARLERTPLRTHHLEVALFELRDGRLAPTKVLPTVVAGDRTVLANAISLPCPDLVLPNHRDHAYLKLKLDPRSHGAARAHLSEAEDPLVRAMLWQVLWEGVRDGELPAASYLLALPRHLGKEPEPKILSTVLATLASPTPRTPSVAYYLPAPRGSGASADPFSNVERFLESELGKAPAGSDQQRVWLQALIHGTRTRPGLARLEALLNGKRRPAGIELDQDLRWTILLKLSSASARDMSASISRELRRDPSDRGQRAAIAAEVAQPRLDTKRRWFLRINEPEGKLPMASLRAAMGNLFPDGQEDLQSRFVAPFFKELDRHLSTRDEEFLLRFSSSLVPALCTKASADALREYLAKKGADLPGAVAKELRVAADENDRCLRIRASSE